MRPKPEYFDLAVVGSGAAATVNLATLPEGNRHQRVAIIGEDHPWRGYHNCDMGQWPRFLELPGCEQIPRDDWQRKQWQLASNFAGEIDQRFERALLNFTHPALIPGRVTLIEPPKKTPGSGYRLKIRAKDGSVTQITAARVDLCTGLEPKLPDGLAAFRHDFENWRAGKQLVLSGEAFCSQDARLPADPEAAIVVYGGSGTAAWCVEHAQRNGRPVVWVARNTIDSALTATGRNQPLIAEAPRRKPAQPGTQLAERHRLLSITVDNAGSRLSLDFAGSSARSCIDHRGNYSPFPTHIGQVVIAVGPRDRPSFLHDNIRVTPTLFKPPQSPLRIPAFPLGSMSADGKLRLLGAAGLPVESENAAPFDEYSKSLHPQSRGLPNFPIALQRIAWANGHPSESLLHATFAELATLVGSTWPDIVNQRRDSGDVPLRRPAR